MSLTTFAGSAQFAAVSILGTGGTLAAAVIAAILLNARYGPIGVDVAPALTGPCGRAFLRAQLVVDETWALSADGRGGSRPEASSSAPVSSSTPRGSAGTAAGVLSAT